MAKKGTEQVEVNNELVHGAYQNLADMVSHHFESAMEVVGEYLLEFFFDHDIELLRTKKPSQKESFNQLINQIENKSSIIPSKSWIYQSMELVVQSHDLSKKGFKIYRMYGEISLNHKLSLLTTNNLDTKIKLIKEIINKNFSDSDVKKLNSDY